jgi:hypothetical protein
MPRPIPGSQLEAIVAGLSKRPEGATLIEIAARLNPAPSLRNVQRWLGTLLKQNRIVREGATNATRYKLANSGTDEDAIPGVSPIAQAVCRLVNQPAAERPPADYRRLFLDAYRPNQTYYLPADVRARFRVPVGAAAGATVDTAMAQPWREPTRFARLLSDLAWRAGWLESLLVEPPTPTLTAVGTDDVSTAGRSVDD